MIRGRMKNDKVRINKTIGNNIKRERKLMGMSREELAEIIDLTPAHMGLIERGERGASHVVLERMTKIFGISYDSFFTDINEIPGHMTDNTEKEAYYKQIFALVSTLDETALNAIVSIIKSVTNLCSAKKVSN